MKNEQFAKACHIIGNMSKLSKAVGITPSFAWQIREGQRPCPPKVSVLIEKLTKGKVSRKKLHPKDYLEIWPELRHEKCPYCGKAIKTGCCMHCGAELEKEPDVG